MIELEFWLDSSLDWANYSLPFIFWASFSSLRKNFESQNAQNAEKEIQKKESVKRLWLIDRAAHVQVDFDEYGGFPNFDIKFP